MYEESEIWQIAIDGIDEDKNESGFKNETLGYTGDDLSYYPKKMDDICFKMHCSDWLELNVLTFSVG